MIRVPGAIFRRINFIKVGPLRSDTTSIQASFVSLYSHFLPIRSMKITCSMPLQPKLQGEFSLRYFFSSKKVIHQFRQWSWGLQYSLLVRRNCEQTSHMYEQKFIVVCFFIPSSRLQNIMECDSLLQ